MADVCFVFRKPRAFYYSIEKIFRSVASILKQKQFSIEEIIVPHSRLTPLNILQNFSTLRSKRAKVYHVTGDAHYLVLRLPGNRTILTIHDIGFVYQTSGLKRWVLKKMMLDWPVRTCRFVTTISEYSRIDVIKNSGCDPAKLIVIPNPVGDNIYFSEKSFDARCPNIFFVGTAEHKNLNRVAEALDGIKCKLEILGPLSELQKELLRKYRVDYHESFSLSEQELARKYSEIDILLFPSLFEGFGLPIIEAQAAGRPVITSNIPPMKDVAGKGACLVDPYDTSSIRTAILKLINEKDYYRAVVKSGLENVKKYSIENITNRYLELYNTILQDK